MNVDLIHDGLLIVPAVGVAKSEVRCYENDFRSLLLIGEAGASIRTHDFCELQYQCGFRQESTLDRLRDESISWWIREHGSDHWRDCFRKRAGMLNLRHLIIEQVATILSESRKGVLPSQCATTRVQPGRLALWLIRRGKALLPWHGVGVIDRHGRFGVESFFQEKRGGEGRCQTLPRETVSVLRWPVGSQQSEDSGVCK